MLKAMYNGIKNIFTPQFIDTLDSVKFRKTEAIDVDIALLTVTIQSSKSVIAMLESTLKMETYQILAREAGAPKAVVEDNLFQMPSNFAHTPVKGRAFN